jgi:hypothetical protein
MTIVDWCTNLAKWALHHSGTVKTSWRFTTSAGLDITFGIKEVANLSAGGGAGYFVVESSAHKNHDVYRCWYEVVEAQLGLCITPTFVVGASGSTEDMSSDAFMNFYTVPWGPSRSGEAGDPIGFLTRAMFITFAQSEVGPALRRMIQGGVHVLEDTGTLTFMFLGGPDYDDVIAANLPPASDAYNLALYKYFALTWGTALGIPGVGVTLACGGVSKIRNLRNNMVIDRQNRHPTVNVLDYRG